MADYNSVHTGQEIDNAITAVQNKESTWDGKLDASQKGAAGGIASLDSGGKVPTTQIPDLDYLPLSGGTLTGDLTGKYITGAWLQATADNHLESAATKVCVQDSSGWVYHRTLAELLADIGAVPTSRKVNNKVLTADITLAASDVGAVPTSRKVNNKPLSADISLAAGDVGAVPTSRTVNGKALSGNITLTADDVSAIPSSQKGVASGVATLGSDGKVPASQLNASGGKRVARFTVGTSTSGWTSADCDYLCDGTADQVEINAAIQALPSTGGEVVILDGTYNITATIAMNKANVKLSGNGAATVLKRMWNSDSNEGVINITATDGGCCVENLQIDGNKATYTSLDNNGIYLSSSDNNTVTGNTCNNNNSNGIYLSGSSSNNTITGNTCNNNNYGIYLVSSDNNTITGNTCNNNNNKGGIYLSGSNNNTITGNTCNNNRYGIYLSGSSSNNTITGNTCNNNNDDYGIYLVKSSNNTVTGNTCNNNYNGIYLYLDSNNTTVTGNTCNDNKNCGIYLSSNSNNNNNNTITGNNCNNNDYGIYLNSSSNNTVTGNTCIRGTGQTSDYTSSQYTIRLKGTSSIPSNNNLIAYNNIMGKNYTSSGGGTGNTFEGNKYN